MACGLRIVISLVFISLAVAAPAQGQSSAKDEATRIEFFEKKVRPVLVENCYNCHSANTNARGGLRVDDRNGLIQGGDRGPAVIPGQPDKSLLMQAIRHTHAQLKMPPKEHLSDEQIADVARWIQEGAAWPEVRHSLPVGKPNPQYDKLRREHWAWQPLRSSQPPEVSSSKWARDSIDHYILAKLDQQKLKPVEDAEPLALIRRLTFDLTGLPPTIEESLAFEHDAAGANRESAIERLVDRLLASPAFGERWGRHWLDVARYGESTGSARNVAYPHAWRYRDYVIDSFNADKPYDQFVREQVAGDLLSAGSQRQRDEQLVATGFLALGVCDVNQRFKVRFVMDNIDEQIDTVTRSILGLTVSCARCHDHKFDPIPTVDYYALAGIFHSSDRCAGVRNKMGGNGMDYYDTAMLLPLGSQTLAVPTPAPETVEPAKVALAQARANLLALQQDTEENTAGSQYEKKLEAARSQVKKMQDSLLVVSDPATHSPVAFGVRDSATVGDTAVRIRGEAEKLGPVVPRGYLSVLKVPQAAPVNPSQSGRRELAEWLTSKHNPLTPRVMANRIWKHLFGEGLVSSVDNFGVTGDVPSHPELLDHLAARLVDNGWSVKKLIRSIVLSRTYQLSSTAPAANLAADPANRWLWRHAPRRLDAEEIRDTMLAASGVLQDNRPQGSPAQYFKISELRNNGPEAAGLEAQAQASRHRSIYLPLLRGLTPRSLDVFDFAEQGMVTGNRDTTTVATQALYLLNDAFVREQAQSLADRLFTSGKLDTADRVQLTYQIALGRSATKVETRRAAQFINDYSAAAREEAATVAGDKKSRPAKPTLAAWVSFCQAIFASAEFRYLQ